MWRKRIVIGDSDISLANIVENSLRKNLYIGYARASSTNFEIIELSEEREWEEWLNDMLSWKIVEYYKYLYLSKILGLEVWSGAKNTKSQLIKSTLVSCLVYYDIAGQVSKVNKMLCGMGQEICLDGIYNFRMQGVYEGWSDMGQMLEDLDSLDITAKDILTVTRHLYGVIKDKTKLAYVSFDSDNNICKKQNDTERIENNSCCKKIGIAYQNNDNTNNQKAGTENIRIVGNENRHIQNTTTQNSGEVWLVDRWGSMEKLEIEKIWASDKENIIATLIKHRVGVLELDKNCCQIPLKILKNLFMVKGYKTT